MNGKNSIGQPGTLFLLSLFLGTTTSCGGEFSNEPENVEEPAASHAGELVAVFPEEMSAYRDAFEQSGLPMATAIGHVERTSALDSKLLGEPYLPPGFEYPRDPDGRPLRLLAQINFADVPPLPGYPDDGILQFYISDDVDGDGQIWGLQFNRDGPYDARAQFELLRSQEYFRVVWHEAIEESQSLSDLGIRFGSQSLMPAEQEARLTFESGVSYPVPGDYRFARVFGKDDWDFFDQFGDKADSVGERYMSHTYVDAIAWLGGYAYFAQDDPRAIAADEDWLLLLEIQSSTRADQPAVLWGDVGTGAFFIRRADLLERDFSDVLYTWDSH